METIGGLIMVVGYLVSLVGGIMVLIKAFQESVLWGLGSIFVPFVSLIFVIQHWQETKQGFLISLGGAAIAILGMVIGVAGSGAM